MNFSLPATLQHALSRATPLAQLLASSPTARHPDREGIPVAPGWLPGVGHVPALLVATPWVYREGDKLGPFFWVQMGPSGWQLVSAREEALAIFRNKETTSAHLAREVPALIGKSVLGVDGDPHRRMRGALNGPFTPKGLSASRAGQLMRGVLGPRIDGWPVDAPVHIADETREFAVDVIFRMMGIPSRDLVEWRKAFEIYGLTALPFRWDFPGSPFRRGMAAKRWIDDRMGQIVQDARKSQPEESMVSAMVHGRDEQGRGLSEEELFDNLRILVFAGHETTASTMAWAILYLAQHPAHWKRLVDESMALDGPPTTPDELAKSPFAEGIFREALRLHPPVAADSRETHTTWELFGRTFKPGEVIGIGLHQLSRDPARYPNPDTFDPTRWVVRDRKPGPVELAQFGGGPHFCLGYHVAWLEAVQFLVTVARRFGAEGRVPTCDGAELPRPIYMPLQRPPQSSVVRFVRG